MHAPASPDLSPVARHATAEAMRFLKRKRTPAEDEALTGLLGWHAFENSPEAGMGQIRPCPIPLDYVNDALSTLDPLDEAERAEWIAAFGSEICRILTEGSGMPLDALVERAPAPAFRRQPSRAERRAVKFKSGRQTEVPPSAAAAFDPRHLIDLIALARHHEIAAPRASVPVLASRAFFDRCLAPRFGEDLYEPTRRLEETFFRIDAGVRATEAAGDVAASVSVAGVAAVVCVVDYGPEPAIVVVLDEEPVVEFRPRSAFAGRENVARSGADEVRWSVPDDLIVCDMCTKDTPIPQDPVPVIDEHACCPACLGQMLARAEKAIQPGRRKP